MIFGVDVVGAIEAAICEWLATGGVICWNFYYIFVSLAASTSSITSSFSTMLGTNASIWSTVQTLNTAVEAIAESILALFMLVQLVKISQRIDATATLPAIKDIVFLFVTFVVLHWFISNALEVVTAVYDEILEVTKSVGNTSLSDANSISMEEFDAESANVGGCILFVILGAVAAFFGGVAAIVASFVALARAVQLLVMGAFSPIPMALLGFDETRQSAISYFKNFCAACLAGAIMMFLFTVYPHLVTGNAVDGLFSICYSSGDLGEDATNAIKNIVAVLPLSVLYIYALLHSGAWAKEILGG